MCYMIFFKFHLIKVNKLILHPSDFKRIKKWNKLIKVNTSFNPTLYLTLVVTESGQIIYFQFEKI